MNKWVHYFDIYDKHFASFRGREVTVLEFGVSHGGSLQMWKEYFGKRAKIIGVDVLPECKKLEEDRVEIFIGDQEDRTFLKSLMGSIGPVDLVIDDGGHEMKQQINTFEEVFPYVNEGGVYLAEDLHTSYWDSHGGGYKRDGTFVEYLKDIVDDLNAWHTKDEQAFAPNENTRRITGMHFYDSIVVLDKGLVSAPVAKKTGKKTVDRRKKRPK